MRHSAEQLFALENESCFGRASLVLELSDQIEQPILLVFLNEKCALLNRRCKQVLDCNSRQFSYLYKVGRVAVRRTIEEEHEWYRITFADSSTKYTARKHFQNKRDGWIWLELLPLEAQIKRNTDFMFEDMVQNSSIFCDTVNQCKQASILGEICVLTGESGTGKATLAKAMHLDGPFSRNNFIYIQNNQEFNDLPILKETNLAEANNVLRGYTLYFDEISSFSHYNQDRLFFLLMRSREKSFKVICATSATLSSLVMKGDWHKNLYEVLKYYTIYVPSLRQRKEDLSELANQSLRRLNIQLGRHHTFSPEIMADIQKYTWPGNFHELESNIRRLVRETSAATGTLTGEIIPKYGFDNTYKLQESFNLKRAEKQLIIDALNAYSSYAFPKKEAAAALGISVSSLYRKISEYGINEQDYYGE